MEKSIKINIEQAKELYKSNNVILKEIALQAFSKVALIGISDFKDITTFKVNIIRKALNLGQDFHLCLS